MEAAATAADTVVVTVEAITAAVVSAMEVVDTEDRRHLPSEDRKIFHGLTEILVTGIIRIAM